MPHSDIEWWNESMEWNDVVDYMYLAINTTWNDLIWITYIVFVTEMQKRQTQRNKFALFENDITGSEPTVKIMDT